MELDDGHGQNFRSEYQLVVHPPCFLTSFPKRSACSDACILFKANLSPIQHVMLHSSNEIVLSYLILETTNMIFETVACLIGVQQTSSCASGNINIEVYVISAYYELTQDLL